MIAEIEETLREATTRYRKELRDFMQKKDISRINRSTSNILMSVALEYSCVEEEVDSAYLNPIIDEFRKALEILKDRSHKTDVENLGSYIQYVSLRIDDLKEISESTVISIAGTPN